MKRHKWKVAGVSHKVCTRCGASCWGKPGGWGRAMKDGKPVKYCPIK